ncbi:ileal sodium/bile acid cotransporter-like isoform X1 [Homarus americanus]|uniref:ileal sodium/bile acid cotransporter-like isoform X1 n=1 Tax=Homarus americanus TaxID=6706 RepID=UPI001C49499E|nr:ileal sodium/bile acid cotransporter-like isoform X1 [Homarus americanus]
MCGGCGKEVAGWWALVVLLLTRVTTAAATTEDKTGVVRFSPADLLKVVDGTNHLVTWFTNVTVTVDRVAAYVVDQFVSEVRGIGEPMQCTPENDNLVACSNVTYYGEVNITALYLGFSNLHVVLYDENNQTVAEGVMEMAVVLRDQNITLIYTYISSALAIIAYFIMGASVDFKIIKGITKKPVGPAIGAISQFVIMPMISFGLGVLLFPNEPYLRLGLFLSGSCPGGGSSNMWTYLLGGSLDLSISMTTISTIFSFGTVPLWVLLLGPVIMKGVDFVIPYSDIAITSATLILPCLIGMVVQYFIPRINVYAKKVLTGFALFNLALLFSFGTYAYRYIFYFFNWQVVGAGLLLPTLGFTGGLIFALILRQPVASAIAISVETGVQNVVIAIIILQLTLSSPNGELSAIIPASCTLFFPLPLALWLLTKTIYDRVKRSRNPDLPSSSGTDLKELPNGVKDIEKNGKMEKSTTKVPVSTGGGVDNLAADLKDEV